MYYIENKNEEDITEEMEINGVSRRIKIFAKEVIYNIEADNIRLSSNTMLCCNYHSEKIITNEMKQYFKKKHIKKLSENIRYRKIAGNNVKKVIIALGEMSLQGHNKNLQYIYTPFNKFIESFFKDDAVIISIIDCKNAVGDLYRYEENEMSRLITFIRNQLSENNLSPKDLIFVGSSIGATAAILLANSFNEVTVISSMPVLCCNQLCIDNNSRKQLYFITGNYEREIIESINPRNKYQIYCGSYDISAHQLKHYELFKRSNVSLSIVNDWHTATRHFKNDILYQVDKQILTYEVVRIKIDNYSSEMINDSLHVNMEADIITSDGMCAYFQISSIDNSFIYKVENRNGVFFINEGVKLSDFFKQEIDINVKLIIIDIEMKTIYESDDFSFCRVHALISLLKK